MTPLDQYDLLVEELFSLGNADGCDDWIGDAYELMGAIENHIERQEMPPLALLAQFEAAVTDAAACVDTDIDYDFTEPQPHYDPAPPEDVEELPDNLGVSVNWPAVVGSGLIVVAGIGYLVTRKK